jgi:hypothetical protein
MKLVKEHLYESYESEIDRILDKISEKGKDSLTKKELDILSGTKKSYEFEDAAPKNIISELIDMIVENNGSIQTEPFVTYGKNFYRIIFEKTRENLSRLKGIYGNEFDKWVSEIVYDYLVIITEDQFYEISSAL